MNDMGGAVINRSRRALLHGGRRTNAPMRPPWALAESHFLDACTRCGDCVTACPEVILTRGDGGFPERITDAGECSFCRDCVAACETGALDAQANSAWRWTVSIGDACLAAQGVVCFSCRDACPERAISFVPSRGVAQPALDASRCNACGACVAACPPSAIRLVANDLDFQEACA